MPLGTATISNCEAPAPNCRKAEPPAARRSCKATETTSDELHEMKEAANRGGLFLFDGDRSA
jgi:hypothetical protein